MHQTREPESGLPLPSTLYLGLDGTGVPMRSTEVQGRAGKQPDGSARTREAKLCTVWSAERRDAQGRPQRDPHSVTYTAAIESAATLEYGPPAFGVRESESSAKANDAVLGKRHGKSSSETERGGSEMLRSSLCGAGVSSPLESGIGPRSVQHNGSGDHVRFPFRKEIRT